METKALNQEWRITIPDGFHEMDEAEHGKINVLGEAPQWSISDPARHVMLSAAWKKSGFASLLLSSKEVAKKMEAAVRGPMQAYGYQLERFLSADVGGIPADGFRYFYTAQGIAMTGESWSIKKGKTFYYLHGYYRTALAEESVPVIRTLFDSSEWV